MAKPTGHYGPSRNRHLIYAYMLGNLFIPPHPHDLYINYAWTMRQFAFNLKRWVGKNG